MQYKMRLISRRQQIVILSQGGDHHGWDIAIYKNMDSESKFSFFSSSSNMEGKVISIARNLRIFRSKENSVRLYGCQQERRETASQGTSEHL